MSNVLKADPRGQTRAAESELRREALRLYSEKNQVRERRSVVHLGGHKFAKVSGIVARSCERDWHVSMVPDMELSHKHEISSATITTTEREAESR